MISSLRDVIIVNDNAQYEIAGDIEIFRCLKHAEAKLESWYVITEHCHAMNGLGEKIVFNAAKDIVIGRIDENNPADLATLVAWLQKTVKSRGSASKASESPASTIEDMITRIGFTI